MPINLGYETHKRGCDHQKGGSFLKWQSYPSAHYGDS